MKVAPILNLCLLLAICAAGCAHGPRTARETANPTPLDTYVAKADSNYAFKVISTSPPAPDAAYTSYVIEMTSQHWLSPEQVDRTEWKHWLVVAKPTELQSDTALLFIGGGKNGSEAPEGPDKRTAMLAVETKSVVATLMMVPNQPLTFLNDPKKEARSEDSLIAYAWNQYLMTGEAEWLPRLPMTKSVVRAMDTIQEFLGDEGTEINSFVVAGGSKRGWTTWTTAAVDNRVVGIAPMVIDLLNTVPSFEHHWKVYGFWAPAVGDYQEQGLMDWSGTPEYDAMLKIVEPFSYRERYTMPKLVMNATGDEFFLPDSSQFYYDQFPEPKRLRYVPNSKHSMGDTDAPMSLASFHEALITGTPLPAYAWTFPDANTIRVTTSDKPIAAKLWQATNPDARDFRVDTIGKAWTSSDLADEGNGVFTGRVEKPAAGFSAFMVELTFAGPGEAPHKFTTPVRVVPDIYPHELVRPATPPKGFLSK